MQMAVWAINGGAKLTPVELKLVDVILEWEKQMLTLSSAIIVATLAFSKDIAPKLKDKEDRKLLATSWSYYLASLVFGLITIGTLIDKLRQKQAPFEDTGLYIWAMPQAICFAAGAAYFIKFGKKWLQVAAELESDEAVKSESNPTSPSADLKNQGQHSASTSSASSPSERSGDNQIDQMQ